MSNQPLFQGQDEVTLLTLAQAQLQQRVREVLTKNILAELMPVLEKHVEEAVKGVVLERITSFEDLQRDAHRLQIDLRINRENR